MGYKVSLGHLPKWRGAKRTGGGENGAGKGETGWVVGGNRWKKFSTIGFSLKIEKM